MHDDRHDWHDLEHHAPGELARERALAEHARMRARSSVGTWLARALDMHTDERAWRVGADGEESVGARLDRLEEHGWQVLHSVPVGRRDSDIDHVVIGPGGVFTVNTKRHPGKKIWVGGDTVMVDGHKVPYVRNSRHEAARATRLLTETVGFPVLVTGVLVFATGFFSPDMTIKKLPDDVRVLDKAQVPKAFQKAQVRLEPDQVHAIYSAARRSTTWRT